MVWHGKKMAGFDGYQWKLYDHANSPLPSDTVLSVAFDQFQNLWIGTARGIAIFNPAGVLL